MSNRHLSVLKPRLTETETSAETTETETDRDRDRPRPRLTEPERLGLGTSLVVALYHFVRSNTVMQALLCYL
jgi:hypothetical protein